MTPSKPAKNSRNSSIELLRILSMIMILSHHFAVHGNFLYSADTVSLPRFWYHFLYMGGKTGVNIFILISGYFLIEDQGPLFQLGKIIRLWAQIFFYSITMALILGALNLADLKQSLLTILFPVSFLAWWFASLYFVLYMLHPFLNKLLRSLSKDQFQKLLLFMIICWSVLPTLFSFFYDHGNNNIMSFHPLFWFIALYCIGSYIRLYGLHPALSHGHYVLLSAAMMLFTFLVSAVLIFLGSRWPGFSLHTTDFYDMEQLPVFLLSVSLFMAFSTAKMSYHKWINTVASTTFGIYLIHDNPLIRSFLWEKLIHGNAFQESIFLIPYSIGVIACLFLVCALLDFFRQRFLERPLMRFVRSREAAWTSHLSSLYRFLINILFGA